MTDFRTGYGAAWLDLLATLLHRWHDTTVECLDDTASARRWFAEHALEPQRAVTAEELATIQRVREALLALALATVEGTPPPAADVETVDTVLATVAPVRLRRNAGRLTLSRPETGAEALARLVRSAVDDLVGPQRDQLRRCGDDTCAGIYLDPTGRRRWCADERCGVRARVRAHRARQRAAAGERSEA